MFTYLTSLLVIATCFLFLLSYFGGRIDPTLVPVVNANVRMALPSKLSSFMVAAALDSTNIFCICRYSRAQYSSFGFSFGYLCRGIVLSL